MTRDEEKKVGVERERPDRKPMPRPQDAPPPGPPPPPHRQDEEPDGP